ncbi:MAG: hypothetical protein HYU66_06005 [Armatimonadetes bacterium]|nr:hypothetical protein [Armatimonadota bacterium]
MAELDTASLWGDVRMDLDLVVTPLTVLREYAATLGPHTRNFVTASVSRVHWSSSDEFCLAFRLDAPLLAYSHNLFFVVHPATKLYPADVRTDLRRGSVGVPVEDEAALRVEVKNRLRAPATTEAIRNLLAQSLSETSDVDEIELPEDASEER